MDEPLVLAENAGRSFGRGSTATQALRHATCAIYPGDRIALTGPSGSGKSTLLHLLGGLDVPTSGSVTGQARGAADLRPGRVVDVFQGPSSCLPCRSWKTSACRSCCEGSPTSEASGQRRTALGLFGLDHLRDKLPEEISGGQAQRVAIARAWPSVPCWSSRTSRRVSSIRRRPWRDSRACSPRSTTSALPSSLRRTTRGRGAAATRLVDARRTT